MRRLGIALLVLALLAPAAGLLLSPRPAPQARSMADGGWTETAEIPRLEPQRGTICVNTADLAELQRLPGVGASYAQAIIDEREAHGWYRIPEDLLRVRGIGAQRLAAMRELLDFSVPETTEEGEN